MKLSPLLAKYLSEHKTLNLPGLGTFTLNNAYDPNIDITKKGNPALRVDFEEKKITEPEEDLIDFIAKESGKMKVLAKSDLDSQLDDVIQYINSGKPYLLNGIGTIIQKPNGSYDFFPITVSQATEKRKVVPVNEKNKIPPAFIDSRKKQPLNKQTPLIILVLTILAIAVIVWYYYDSRQPVSNDISTTDTQASQNHAVLTPNEPSKADSPSTLATNAPAHLNGNTYKYILEKATKPRAEKRFAQLRQLNWPVELEALDSNTYKIVMKLTNADTSRVKDSLRILSGKTVHIEK